MILPLADLALARSRSGWSAPEHPAVPQEHLADAMEASIRKGDVNAILDGLRQLFNRRKHGAVAAAGAAEPDIPPRILHAVVRSFEWAHASVQIGELGCGWLALSVDGTPRPFREALWGTPGLADALCRIGENGSAQARVFAGMCLKELLKGMGYKRARELIEMPGFPPCINSMLCSPLEEERLSGTLILGELIGEGGEEAVNLIFRTCAVAVASLLASLRQSNQADALVGLWCVGRLARSSSGRKALKEAETVELLRRWAKSHNCANEGEAYNAEHLLATQGLLLVALVNADTAKPREFDMLAHALTPFLGAACQHPSRSWRLNFVRLELWEILYTLSRLMPLQDKELNFDYSTILDFMMHAFHEGVREIAMWREHKYASAAPSASLHVSHGSKTSSDRPNNDVVDDNLWTRWELAFEYLGRCMHQLASHRNCRQQMIASHLATCLEAFVVLQNEGCERGLCRQNVNTDTWACGIIHALSLDAEKGQEGALYDGSGCHALSSANSAVDAKTSPLPSGVPTAKAASMQDAVKADADSGGLLFGPQLGSNDENVSPQTNLKRLGADGVISTQKKSQRDSGPGRQGSALHVSVKKGCTVGQEEGAGSCASAREARLAMALERTVVRMRVTRTLRCAFDALEWNCRTGFQAKQHAVVLFVQHSKGLAVKIMHRWRFGTCRAKWMRHLAAFACFRVDKNVIAGHFAHWKHNRLSQQRPQSFRATLLPWSSHCGDSEAEKQMRTSAWPDDRMRVVQLSGDARHEAVRVHASTTSTVAINAHHSACYHNAPCTSDSAYYFPADSALHHSGSPCSVTVGSERGASDINSRFEEASVLEDQMKALKSDIDQVMSRLTLHHLTTSPGLSFPARAAAADDGSMLSPWSHSDFDLPPPPPICGLGEGNATEREADEVRNDTGMKPPPPPRNTAAGIQSQPSVLMSMGLSSFSSSHEGDLAGTLRPGLRALIGAADTGPWCVHDGGGQYAPSSWQYSRPFKSSQQSLPSAYVAFQDNTLGRYTFINGESDVVGEGRTGTRVRAPVRMLREANKEAA